MNRHFYEFWGHVFTHIAQGQKQLEDMNAWMRQGFSGAQELNELFRHCYGLKPGKTDSTQDSKVWQDAVNDFQQALSQLAAQWGWVSQSEHQKALDHIKALETQVREQQANIRELRDLLDQEGLGHSELFQHLKGALKEQSDQFHALMESIHGTIKDKT
ncbi:MAG: hypothetical protein WBG37_04370 [Desulfobacterales bacterium]